MEKRQRRQAARISASARTWKAFGRELSVDEELKKKIKEEEKERLISRLPFNKPTNKS